MKAVQLIQPGQPLERQAVALPAIGPDDLLVRVKAAGICHSDAHYRAGVSPAGPLPLTLGHEVAGLVEKVGTAVTEFKKKDRVCVHYLVTCGNCRYCRQGREQFCTSGAMLGKDRDGGYAEFLRIPARNAFPLPAEIPFEQGAILMCSSATALHALYKGRIKAGESVAIFGIGGLGISAVQLARELGAQEIYAVDIKPSKLELAREFGAIPIHAKITDPVDKIKQLTNDRGVDVALELIGLPLAMQQAVEALTVFGRAVLAGLTDQTFEVSPYKNLIKKEAELIGVSDHLASEIPPLIDWVLSKKLDLSNVVTSTIGLEAGAINRILDDLETFSQEIRVVIIP